MEARGTHAAKGDQRLMNLKLRGAKWHQVPTPEAHRKFGLEALSGGVITPQALASLVGGEPPPFVLVHHGDLRLDKSTRVVMMPGAPTPVPYVIDGSLTIEGAFVFEGWDAYTPLFVTGALRARAVGLLFDATLVVGALKLEQLLYTALGDAGTLLVRKSVEAKLWLDAGGRGMIVAKKSRGTKRVTNPDNGEKNPVARHVVARFVDELSTDDEGVMEALLEGKPVLARP